jgi:5S rRNA maturation endonuclease (ribonuclease M5)
MKKTISAVIVVEGTTDANWLNAFIDAESSSPMEVMFHVKQLNI